MRPRLPLVGLALQVELLGQPPSGLGGREPGDGGEPGEAEEAEPLLARRREVRRRRAQHQPGDALAVALPDQLGDRPAHRVADGDERVDAEHVAHGDGVVGAVLQAERLARPDAATVAAVVDGDDPVVLGRAAGSR